MPATTYNYTVAARDAAGNVSSESAIASATTANTVFPLHTEAGKRYLVDAAGKPFLLHGDAAWSLISDLSQADAELYLEDRRQRGFNTVLVELIDDQFSTHAPNNYYNVAPFTTVGDYSTPNEAYFAHADWVIQKAAAKGMLVLLTASYLGYQGGDQGWYQTMVANGTTKMRNYGRYLGQRYAGYSNILWVHGGDYDPPNQDLVRQIALGIREFDTHSLHTIHTDSETVLLDKWPSESWLQVNNVYTYNTVYAPVLTEYARPGGMPVFFMEGRYENENMGTAPPAAGDERRVRIQAYQALLSGAMGHVFGNNPVWHFTYNGNDIFPSTRGLETVAQQPRRTEHDPCPQPVRTACLVDARTRCHQRRADRRSEQRPRPGRGRTCQRWFAGHRLSAESAPGHRRPDQAGRAQCERALVRSVHWNLLNGRRLALRRIRFQELHPGWQQRLRIR